MNYDIKGVFIRPLGGNGIFDGYGLKHYKGKIRGELNDAYGPSGIVGKLNTKEGQMVFDKRYLDRTDKIKYLFEKNKQGIWVGGYNFGEIFSGEAFCEGIVTGESLNLIGRKLQGQGECLQLVQMNGLKEC